MLYNEPKSSIYLTVKFSETSTGHFQWFTEMKKNHDNFTRVSVYVDLINMVH